MESNSQLQTQTEHLMRSWVGVRKGQAVLTERRFDQISPLTDSSYRRRRKPGYSDTEEITVISARDLWEKTSRKKVLSPEIETRMVHNPKTINI
ncbi:hypothetical protein PanWU01x14_105820 [Parasponia andersonii]|uniref:Uncharacterized protein n=1 Tax=Parasponia andersonii TaxID=3476 RepID=A0A2P5D133_PARAD|nr:hypothetical protein PanWU01x14_105820 [Parasponia andersonii]